MKTATLFLALFLLFKPLIPLVEYAAFYDYIKNELCINKEVPELQCHGKCHLKEQLIKASNSESDNEKSHSTFMEQSVVFFQNLNTDYSFFFQKTQHLKMNTSYNNNYKYDYIGGIFHPPLS